MPRRSLSPEDRALQEQVDKETKVSSYIDNIYQAVTTGDLNAVKKQVPNRAPGATRAYANESDGMHMPDLAGVFLASQDTPTESLEKTPVVTAEVKQHPGFKISQNQFRAIKSYPQIVEFLGTQHGVSLAQKIVGEINGFVAKQIEANTKLVHDDAKQCVAKNQNIHQFFQGEGWVCQVTASGPFTGNEAFYYKADTNSVYVLRKYGNSQFADATDEFNIIHDLQVVEIDEEGDSNES